MSTKINDNSHFQRNNLDNSSSPYLLQHTSNPVWWQEWGSEVLEYAVSENKPLLVSVGYATCHWCHVMASEAFSDTATANYLNENFICIKVDREQRPDIDQFMMDFINSQNGRGGWPLNVFLTPSVRPVFAMTYAPAAERDSMYSFLSVCEQVKTFYERNGSSVAEFIPRENLPQVSDETSPVQELSRYYDSENGGFGNGQKFPSHSTLLYLLYQLSIDDSPTIRTICRKTLDVIIQRGLNDHLQGGIFRYCVDREWTIPHFEKMLYDQAMALWVFSLGYSVTRNDDYKSMSERIIKCLDESFESEGLYISAHDADTNHHEGATYVWSFDELKDLLLPGEFEKLSDSYYITKTGNFDGKNHLIRKDWKPLKEIEDKLLAVRLKRNQPASDRKIISGINALTAIALIQAGRFLDKPELELKASSVINNILKKFWDGTTLGHSSFNGVVQSQPFLSDAAAMLTAITMLCESDAEWTILMNKFTAYVESFKQKGKWIESDATDFRRVYASCFDHPFPSAVSLAEMGLTRAAILTGKDIQMRDNRQSFQSDFYNLTAMINNGQFHIYTTKRQVSWTSLPANTIQVRGENESDCFMGTCSPM
jgi:uncharacterized protein